MFIPIHAAAVKPTQTRHSRALSQRVDQVIRDYKRDNPELREDEIRAALAQSSPVTGDEGGDARRRRITAIALAGAVALGAGILGTLRAGDGVAAGSGAAAAPGQSVWAIVPIVVAVAAAIVGMIVRARR